MFHEGLFLGVEGDHFQDHHHDRASPSHLHPGRLHVCHDCPARLHCWRYGIAGDVSLFRRKMMACILKVETDTLPLTMDRLHSLT